MLADFHLRLTQLYRSLENEGGNDWPPDAKFFSIINAFNFVEAVLECWKSDKVYLITLINTGIDRSLFIRFLRT